MRRPLDLNLPRSRRVPRVALGLSLLVHIVLFTWWRVEGRVPLISPGPIRLLALTPPESEPPLAITSPYSLPRKMEGEGRASRAKLPRPSPPHEVPVARTIPPAPAQSPDQVADTQTAAGHGPIGRIGPDLGNGRLWVRPLPLPPQALAQRLRGTNEQLADSLVTATIQAFLDSIGMEPGAEQAKLPDWTTEIHGLKFGLDSKNIYVAGLKIPAAVLALLPLPAAGNQSKALDHTSEFIFEDLRRAAARASTMADFKQAIRDIRERKEREREFQKAQRTPPDSVKD